MCAGQDGGISGPGNREKIRASVSLAHMELCRERAVLACMRVVGEEVSHQQCRHHACARAEPWCSWQSFRGTWQLRLCKAFTRLCLPAQNILGLQGIPRQFFLQVYETLRRIGETRSAPTLLCTPAAVGSRAASLPISLVTPWSNFSVPAQHCDTTASSQPFPFQLQI